MAVAIIGSLFILPAGAQVTARDVAEHHQRHGHEQWRGGTGDSGHQWVAYRRQARAINRYVRAVAANRLYACARDPHCAVKLASWLSHAPYSLVHAIVGCESGYRPDAANPSSSAGGLFQYLSGTWSGVAPSYGMGNHSRFETWPAAWVGANHIRDGGPSPWNASRHCWG